MELEESTFLSLPYNTELQPSKEYGILTKTEIHNHLHFYILTMKNQKEKLRNQSHSPLQQKELHI